MTLIVRYLILIMRLGPEMDERVFIPKIGKPIPEWDLMHRLSTSGYVGPAIKDVATIYRFNSVFMDISDQPNMTRQWIAGATLMGLFGACLMLYAICATTGLYPMLIVDFVDIFGNVMLFSFLLGFLYCSFRIGRDEFFSLKRRPIRLNRRNKTISTIRRRRFFSNVSSGDSTWSMPWDENAIFCVHKGITNDGTCYHIRHYEIDKNGLVIRAFALGRSWPEDENLQGLLSQWEYWCWFMKYGPEKLPLPALFLSENESIKESFLYCMLDFGMQASLAFRIAFMPYILLNTLFRLLGQWTCRQPRWPADILKESEIPVDDKYSQPSGDTPVGWADTGAARDRKTYPFDPKGELSNWRGEPDPAANGLLWARNSPPKVPPPLLPFDIRAPRAHSTSA